MDGDHGWSRGGWGGTVCSNMDGPARLVIAQTIYGVTDLGLSQSA